MKTILFLSLSLLTVVFTSCNSLKLPVSVPKCVETKIREIQAEPVANPPIEVWQWKNAGTTYYYITSPCCDQFTTLYDENCVKLCAPDGGFTGKGDGKCPEFTGETEKTLVWKDLRKKS